ncbi:MAG: hypothetical protein ACYC3Q_00825 [Gemmatimonadaceae bacterium]
MKNVASLVVILSLTTALRLSAQHAGHGTANTPGATAQPPRSTRLESVTYEPKESEGPVTFAVAPVWDRGRLELRLSANTHSGDLAAIDLWKAVRVVAGPDTLRPAGAEPLAGHHAQARVSFLLPEAPDEFTVVLQHDSLATPRELRWQRRGAGAATP